MLSLDGRSFTQGRARFEDRGDPFSEPTSKIFVKVKLGRGVTFLGQLDTGAAFSILAPEIAAELGIVGDRGTEIPLSTRLGHLQGRLCRIPLTLVADEGTSLDVEATILIPTEVPEGWPRGIFLGYTGLLDRIRFALDPQKNHFYFGGTEELT